MTYRFLVDTYATERLKVLGLWSMYADVDLAVRPHATDERGRSVLEHMVHQCVSENLWFVDMLGIDVGAPPLPDEETRLGFIRRYRADSRARLDALRTEAQEWWEEEVRFFDVDRSRAWVMVRRVAHTAHHRGQLAAMLRMLGRDLHSTYGPTADTGGLFQNAAPTIYGYPDAEALVLGEEVGGRKAELPGPGDKAPTERPEA